MEYVRAFVVGGAICIIGQILIDKTNLMSGRILVMFVVLGAVLHGIGLYEPIVEFGGAGATVPLPGFGYSLAKGAIQEVEKVGLRGAFTGGLKATAAGITAAILFAFIASLIFNPKAKD
ncbi:stage V sporulation protein AE [Defluviitalea phaphyphila]|uniref:stage V sporulation protein AE n=1 Tax=Defluviitalea phaphyphila TaxID=1473580 RepID=UPI000730CBE8|nr:stage V sporulation protein AE [Defluviitalea phaphyphila]